MVPFIPDELPDLSNTDIFLAAGRFDPIIPPGNTQRLATMLEEAGARVELFWHEGGHGLTRDEIERASMWLSKKR